VSLYWVFGGRKLVGLISTVRRLVRLDEVQFFGLTHRVLDLPSEKSSGHFNGLALLDSKAQIEEFHSRPGLHVGH
jgi:hypothetical protein